LTAQLPPPIRSRAALIPSANCPAHEVARCGGVAMLLDCHRSDERMPAEIGPGPQLGPDDLGGILTITREPCPPSRRTEVPWHAHLSPC
jgi:hypothetical protein